MRTLRLGEEKKKKELRRKRKKETTGRNIMAYHITLGGHNDGASITIKTLI